MKEIAEVEIDRENAHEIEPDKNSTANVNQETALEIDFRMI